MRRVFFRHEMFADLSWLVLKLYVFALINWINQLLVKPPDGQTLNTFGEATLRTNSSLLVKPPDGQILNTLFNIIILINKQKSFNFPKVIKLRLKFRA
jgi:hypothetical protein